jgi:CRISPR/Cas system endoribonuclease Cas6 (RAMP superfamily)
MQQEVDQTHLPAAIRDYLLATYNGDIDMNELAQHLKIPLTELLEFAPNDEELFKIVILNERQEIQNHFSSFHLEQQSALDALIISGQEMFDRFQTVNPFILSKIRKKYPDFYESEIVPHLTDVKEKLKANILKGIEEGFYKSDNDADSLTDRLIEQLLLYQEPAKNRAIHLSFGMVFNNFFESFIQDITTEEGWNYFLRRRQLIEALDFGHCL